MPRLLNSFGRTRTYVNNDGYVVFDSTTAGTYSVDLGAGIYNVILIGGGGGGAYCHYGSGHSILEFCTQGGVAGTIECIIRVRKDVTATLVLGNGGTTNTLLSQGNVSGDDGMVSSISGIEQVTLVAGRGTGGSISNGSYTTPGIMGTNTIGGDEVLKVIMDSNEHLIVSDSVKGPARNRNYQPNVFYGRGGGIAGTGLTPTIYAGGVPYCRIKKIETDLYNL